MDQQMLIKESAFIAGGNRVSRQDQRNTTQDQHTKGGQYGNSGRAQRVCFYCDKPGHIARYCWKKDQDKKQREVEEHRNQTNFAQAAYHTSGDDNTVTVEQVYVSAHVATGASDRSLWLIDSGASSHMCCDRDMFDTFEYMKPVEIVVGNDQKMKAFGRGTVRMMNKVEQDGKTVELRGILREVLYVPQLPTNLFSVSKAATRGLTVTFDGKACTIKRSSGDRATVALGVKEHNLYKLQCKVLKMRK